jgi:hypothetical protein
MNIASRVRRFCFVALRPGETSASGPLWGYYDKF